MALPDIRNRARYLFVAVLVGHILLISSQVNARPGVSLLRHALVTAVTEVQRAAWAVVGGVADVWHAYVALRAVHAENTRLSAEVVALRVELQQQRAVSYGTERLRSLLDLRTRPGWITTGAEVIAGSSSTDSWTVTIDKGAQAGVQTDMAVIAAAGVVGRIVAPAARSASVQLLTDPSAAAAVMVPRSGAQGVVLGQGSKPMRLEFLAATADVVEGDVVVTAGLEGIYPKGLLVGRVSVVERAGTTIRDVRVVPVVDFFSLDTVLVVLSPVSGGAPL